MGFEMSDEENNAMSANHIWTHPQFMVADVCRVTGATPKALEHFVNPKRDLVRLVGAHANPGTGRRRIFTGGQVLMIAAAYAMTRIGFPQRFSRTLADVVERRAIYRGMPAIYPQTNLMLATYPTQDGEDWAFQALWEEMGKEPDLPIAVHLLDVDRLIDQVKAQLEAIVNEEEFPDFTTPDPKPEPNPYSPASNFFRAWEKSASGRWVYVGLSEEETDELLGMQGLEINGDDLDIVTEETSGGPRYLELFEKHEFERLKRIGMNLEDDQ